MGVHASRQASEIAALRLGLELGMTLIDTAEMYGDGGAEKVVSKAIEGRREEVFLVTKVLPQNASRAGTMKAAEGSLARLRTDHVDLYLLHWPGDHPVEETLAAFDRLRQDGKILHYGLSNFDLHEFQEATRHPAGALVAANQVLYNLTRRGIERNLLPWCRQRHIAVMAYTPVEQGRLAKGAALRRIADRNGVSPACVAIAWTLRHEGVVSIPKAANPEHVRENAAAAGLELTPEELAELDSTYPAPKRDVPLETL